MQKGFILSLICVALPLFGGMEESASSFGIPTQAPPAELVEVAPASPGAAYVWVPGHWSWKGAWIWEKGHWTIRPHPDAEWVAGHWSTRHHGWVWVAGRWR